MKNFKNMCYKPIMIRECRPTNNAELNVTGVQVTSLSLLNYDETIAWVCDMMCDGFEVKFISTYVLSEGNYIPNGILTDKQFEELLYG